MIDRVIIFSLESLADRQQVCREQLEEVNLVPSEKIHIWNGVDSADFEKSSDLLRYAIENHGYTFLQDALDLGIQNISKIYTIGQMISTLDVLKHITDKDLTALLLFDDAAIQGATFDEILHVLENEVREDFYAVAIPDEYLYQNMDHLKDLGTHDWELEEGRQTLDGLQVEADNGLIISPTGAKFLFDLLASEVRNAWAVFLQSALNNRLRNTINESHRDKFYTFTDVRLVHTAHDGVLSNSDRSIEDTADVWDSEADFLIS